MVCIDHRERLGMITGLILCNWQVLFEALFPVIGLKRCHLVSKGMFGDRKGRRSLPAPERSLWRQTEWLGGKMLREEGAYVVYI